MTTPLPVKPSFQAGKTFMWMWDLGATGQRSKLVAYKSRCASATGLEEGGRDKGGISWQKPWALVLPTKPHRVFLFVCSFLSPRILDDGIQSFYENP